MGNICRSPTAEGVFRRLVQDRGLEDLINIDSAGTHAYHVGYEPDVRAQAAAQGRGVDLSAQRARCVCAEDFAAFDLIIAMDRDNLAHLKEACPEEHQDKLVLLLAYAPYLGVEEVPDPYYGGTNGFERVLDLIEAAAQGLLESILSRQTMVQQQGPDAGAAVTGQGDE